MNGNTYTTAHKAGVSSGSSGRRCACEIALFVERHHAIGPDVDGYHDPWLSAGFGGNPANLNGNKAGTEEID